jgi:hypothetical protein
VIYLRFWHAENGGFCADVCGFLAEDGVCARVLIHRTIAVYTDLWIFKKLPPAIDPGSLTKFCGSTLDPVWIKDPLRTYRNNVHVFLYFSGPRTECFLYDLLPRFFF